MPVVLSCSTLQLQKSVQAAWPCSYITAVRNLHQKRRMSNKTKEGKQRGLLWQPRPRFVLCLQAALDRFAFMTSTTALGVIIALQPLALLKKHIQVVFLFLRLWTPSPTRATPPPSFLPPPALFLLPLSSAALELLKKHIQLVFPFPPR